MIITEYIALLMPVNINALEDNYHYLLLNQIKNDQTI